MVDERVAAMVAELGLATVLANLGALVREEEARLEEAEPDNLAAIAECDKMAGHIYAAAKMAADSWVD